MINELGLYDMFGL